MIFINMDLKHSIKKIIKENLEDFDWIKNTKPSLLNKIIVFEPMLDKNETDLLLSYLMSHVVTWDEDIVWWGSGDLLDEFEPIDDGMYLHHIIISNYGRMAYGGLDNYTTDELRGDGWSEDEIRNSYEGLEDDIKNFISDNSNVFYLPEKINGRNYFGL